MNYIIDRSNRLANSSCWEWHYIMNIFRCLESRGLSKYKCIFTDNLLTLPAQPDENTIVFIVSDEHYNIPVYAKNVKMIFKNYVFPEQESLNIFPIPQGHNKDLIFFPYKDINSRKYDVSFQGNFHTTRPMVIKSILEEINSRKLNINLLFKNTQDAFEYSNNLSESKISLCLDGQVTPESFRFFESSILGCAIIGSCNYPKNWIYNQDHYIKVNWRNPKDIVDKIELLLTNPNLLEEYALKSYQAWNHLYKPENVCDYIINKLNE